MKKRTFLIDCDTGTDDAIAIMAALYSKDIEVAAITSVNGNVGQNYTSQNNLDLLEYLGIDSVLVGRGASRPLYPRQEDGSLTHGKTGLGDIQLPTAQKISFADDYAVELIRKKLEEMDGELELLVTGPMTNIALLLSLYPAIAGKIRHLWFMGGAVKGGNVTTTAEFNVWVDPYAARLVLASGIPCTMVGLDVTEKAIMNREDEAALRAMGTKASVLTADILDFMLRRYDAGGEDALMHDALALGAALCPECLVCEDYFVDVECDGTYTSGHTAVDLKGKSGKAPNVSVAVELKLDLFKQWLIGSIGNSREV